MCGGDVCVYFFIKRKGERERKKESERERRKDGEKMRKETVQKEDKYI